MMRSNKSSWILLSVFVFVILFLELTFKARLLYFEFRAEHIMTMDFLRNILFTITYGLFVLVFLKMFRQNTVKHLFVVFNLLLVVLYFSQDIYYLIANNFYSFAFSGDVAKGFTFFYRLPQSLTWGHFFYLIPLIAMYFFLRTVHKKSLNIFEIRYKSLKQPILFSLLALLSLFISVQTISSEKNPDNLFDFSDYDLYLQPMVPHTVMRKFGLLSYARIDLQNAFTDRGDAFDLEEVTRNFFNEKPSHENNLMSGVFEGKNLIMIMAEAFDTYAIDPYLTPNIYNMMQQSWVFDNFYAPLYYRNTADTEFMVQTGFYPNKNVQLSMNYYHDNTFPNTFPRLFAQENYISLAFHNFSDHFYPRESFFPHTLGYDEFYGADRLEFIVPPDREREARGHYWHSDLELIEKGLPYLLEHDQFFGYFLTVTGHLPYEASRHDYALKHYPLIQDILESTGRGDIPESMKYYHASQWELDLAIGYLLETLEAAGVLEDTVIVLFGDHYAYGLERDVIWDYDTVKDPITSLNIHNVPFLIYSSDNTPRTYDRLFSSVDILPTLANMFGLNLDYSQIIGSDAFNTQTNTVIFSSMSFLSSNYYFEVERDVFEYFVPYGRIEDVRPLIGQIYYQVLINNYVLDNDYFGPFYGLDSPEEDSHS